LIKEHFTGGVYPTVAPAFQWKSIDEMLENSSLETLPLWLLGSDWDSQRNARRLGQTGAARLDVAAELSLARVAQRDYAGALQILDGPLTAAHGKFSLDHLKLLLYLLGKNGKIDDARALIASLDVEKTPAIGSFVDWYRVRFDGQASPPAANVAR
jgi:hypothetical protein